MSLIEKIDARISVYKEKQSNSDYAGSIAYQNIINGLNDAKQIILSEQKESCNYTLEDDDANTWECNKCGVEWVLEAGTPKDNEMNFCPKCGMEIEEVSHD